METSAIVESVQGDLSAFAAMGDEAAARAADRIAVALGPALRVRLLEALTEAANELAPQLPEGRVEVRLQGGDPFLTYVEDAPSPRPVAGQESSEARITLRLPESLKARLETAAAREGVSVNGWLVQAIVRSLETRARRIGSRLTGYARS
jgi:hypothetical protein